jgi:hypothetical protein
MNNRLVLLFYFTDNMEMVNNLPTETDPKRPKIESNYIQSQIDLDKSKGNLKVILLFTCGQNVEIL